MAAASQTRWWVSLSWADAHAKGRGRRGLGEGGHAGDKPGRVGSAKVCGRLKRAQASSSERTRVRFGAEGKEEAGFILASVPLAVIGGAADQGRRTRGEAPLARARGGTWGRARLVALPLRGGPLALSSSSPLTLEQTQQSALASAWHHALPPSKGLALQSTRPLVPRCRPSRHHSTTPRSARPLALQQQLPARAPPSGAPAPKSIFGAVSTTQTTRKKHSASPTKPSREPRSRYSGDDDLTGNLTGTLDGPSRRSSPTKQGSLAAGGGVGRSGIVSNDWDPSTLAGDSKRSSPSKKGRHVRCRLSGLNQDSRVLTVAREVAV